MVDLTSSELKDSDRRWAAVQSRDKTQDGAFVYAVRTTGVYCRPSCPSRPARVENVLFFEDGVAAAHAGFRACKRCRPDAASADAHLRAVVLAACAALERSDSGIKLDALARRAELNPQHFHRLFKRMIGLTPKRYFQAVRAKRVTRTLRDSDSVTDALYDAGFNSSSRFYTDAQVSLGMQPRQYRRGAEGQRIRYAIERCALGMVLVAATDKGVCAIEFADSGAELEQRLRGCFPKARILPADAQFTAWIAGVLRYIEQPRGLLQLPLDVRGTVFQRRVWDALRVIPSGQTASYTAIANAIGQPSAVRAVAQACANNPIALAIPCHRVIRGDGGTAGYRWGVQRKVELLEREANGATAPRDDPS